ncbi:MAG: AraC family ligand binding domain-containing protein, partial [Verrucomicrobiota bacterium]
MPLNLKNFGNHLEILVVAIHEFAQGWMWKREAGDHFNLWLALEGQGVFEHAGKSWPFSSGSIFLLPPGLATNGFATGGLRMINFSAHIKADAKAAAMLNRLAQGAKPA